MPSAGKRKPLPRKAKAGNAQSKRPRPAVEASTVSNHPLMSDQAVEAIVNKVMEKVNANLSQPANSLLEVPATAVAPEQNPPSSSSPANDQTPHESITSSLVEGAVQAVHSAITGEASAAAVPDNLFSSPSLPIDARVSDRLRAKIWNNEYFEFSLLLSNPVHDGKYQLTISSSASAGSAQALSLEPITKAKKALNLDNWLKCFYIFVAVFTRKYPSEAPGLMKYGEVVQDLASRNHNWRFYDENFRYLRQSNPSAFPWEKIHWELWMRAFHMPSVKPPVSRPAHSRSGGETPPTGYCYRFSRGKECSGGCSYKHLCFKCEGTHPPKQCSNFRPQSRPAKSAPASGSSTTKPKA